MWVGIAFISVAFIVLLFVILICYIKSNERRIHNIEKRLMGQDIVIEKLYTTLLQIVDRQKAIEGKLKHYFKI